MFCYEKNLCAIFLTRDVLSYLLSLEDDMTCMKINIYNYLGCHYMTSIGPTNDFLMTLLRDRK